VGLQRSVQTLACFEGFFSKEAWTHLSGGSEVDEALMEMQRVQLVVPDGEGYRLRTLVRRYLRACHPPSADLLDRFAAWVVRFGDPGCRKEAWAGEDAGIWLRRQREAGDLEGVGQRALEQGEWEVLERAIAAAHSRQGCVVSPSVVERWTEAWLAHAMGPGTGIVSGLQALYDPTEARIPRLLAVAEQTALDPLLEGAVRLALAVHFLQNEQSERAVQEADRAEQAWTSVGRRSAARSMRAVRAMSLVQCEGAFAADEALHRAIEEAVASADPVEETRLRIHRWGLRFHAGLPLDPSEAEANLQAAYAIRNPQWTAYALLHLFQLRAVEPGERPACDLLWEECEGLLKVSGLPMLRDTLWREGAMWRMGQGEVEVGIRWLELNADRWVQLQQGPMALLSLAEAAVAAWTPSRAQSVWAWWGFTAQHHPRAWRPPLVRLAAAAAEACGILRQRAAMDALVSNPASALGVFPAATLVWAHRAGRGWYRLGEVGRAKEQIHQALELHRRLQCRFQGIQLEEQRSKALLG